MGGRIERVCLIGGGGLIGCLERVCLIGELIEKFERVSELVVF